MNEMPKNVFRARSLRRYAEQREQAVLPQFVSPKVFLALWLLLGLLAVVALLLWLSLFGG